MVKILSLTFFEEVPISLEEQIEIDRRIANIILGEVNGVRLDVYSTKDHSIYDQGYNQETNADSGAGDDPVI